MEFCIKVETNTAGFLYFIYQTAIKARDFPGKWLAKQASLMKLTSSFDIQSVFHNCLSKLEANNKSFLSCQMNISYDKNCSFFTKKSLKTACFQSVGLSHGTYCLNRIVLLTKFCSTWTDNKYIKFFTQ